MKSKVNNQHDLLSHCTQTTAASACKQFNMEIIKGSLEGKTLKKRILIGAPLDQGQFGKVHSCIDKLYPSRQLVIKVSDNYQMITREVQALKDIDSPFVPQIYFKGIFVHEQQENQLMSYIVMPKYGQTLEKIYCDLDQNLSDKTIYQIGIQLLQVLDSIHKAGYTYNDLKLDNIMVGDADFSEGSRHQVKLIDFGFSERYLDSNNKHLTQVQSNYFRGNLSFATLNQFEFKSTSRKDDLVSLCYLLIYLLNQGEVDFAPSDFNINKKQLFHQIRKVKQQNLHHQVGSVRKHSPYFMEFLKDVDNLKFCETPNYNKMAKLLECCMGKPGDNFYDWSLDDEECNLEDNSPQESTVNFKMQSMQQLSYKRLGIIKSR